ncbi:MAG: DUF4442 domain-containing protein [Bacterioplanes sp.]|nr:DUF4442 domain-containing protein [Bacterioplanes sp.]
MKLSLSTFEIWQILQSKLFGKWVFSKLLCMKAPYFGSISPRFNELRPNYCKVHVAKRRSILNHFGTVHAIAMCNMAELAGGTMTEVTVPSTHRWIPKGMTVEYLKKASSELTAIATPLGEFDWSTAGKFLVGVEIKDLAGVCVFRATISMWVAPKPCKL